MRKMDYPKDKYVVYIVDNATTPETVAYLKEVYPEAVVLPNAVNAGWGGGNNVGIEQAFKDGCEDIVLSNMDVIVHKDWLSELAKAAYSDSPPPQSSPTRGEEKTIRIKLTHCRDRSAPLPIFQEARRPPRRLSPKSPSSSWLLRSP